MNNDLPQDQPAEAMRAQDTTASATGAELIAIAELLEHYAVFSRIRSKLWHANLDSDQRAIAEYEPRFKEAESAYRKARRVAGQAIFDARKATWGLHWAQEELPPMPNIVLSGRLAHGTTDTYNRADLIRLAVDDPPNFVDDVNSHLSRGKLGRPIKFITVATPNAFFNTDGAPSEASTKATVEQFAADVDRFLAERGRKITPES